MDSPPHITIDSESMQEDSTNIIVNEEEEDPFKDLGPAIVGNIMDYSNSIDEEREDEKLKKVKEDSRKEEVIVANDKLEANTLKDA